MSFKNSVIEKLKKILPDDQVLSDKEDRYVYSFEKIFLNQSNIMPDIIIRVSSQNEKKKIKSLIEKEKLSLIERGKPFEAPVDNSSKPFILLDNIEIPILQNCIEKSEEKDQEWLEINKLGIKGYGTYRNLSLAVKNLILGKTLSKCQNCSTCTGYCTVSPSFKGIESWSSKGRILLTRGIMKGELTLSDKITEILYNCTKCGLCYAQCFQNLEFHEAILFMRHLIAEKNLVPEVFKIASKNIFELGDPAAIPSTRRLSRIRNLNRFNFPEKANNLLWLGCTVATRTPKTAEALIHLLNRSNTEYTMLGKEEGCCGYVLISAGLWTEAKKVANRAIEKISQTKAENIITPCSGCYYTFKRLYPEILDIEVPFNILHSSQFIEQKVKDGMIDFKPLDLKVTYHDPCSLGRHNKVYEPPRNILKSIPNLNLIEMALNKECARCCGGGGGLWTFNNHVSLEATQKRLKEDMIPLDVNILTTSCPQCQLNFRFASRMKEFADIAFKIYDITEIVELAIQPEL